MSPKLEHEERLAPSPSSVCDGDSNDRPCDPTSHAFYFLSAIAAHTLPQFQYKGEDRSLLYAYVLSPFATFCVEHTPRWMAPNLITLIGLVFMISSYCIMWFYVPTLEGNNIYDEEVPRWIFLWNAICILLYQTLDNMDGKQARRTGSSSPLGLLFDHGCDAVNSLFGSVNWMIAMGLNVRVDSWLCYTMLFGPYAMFYFATWEEYNTGELILPIINGPNEGLIGAVLMSLTSYVKGPEFWHQTNGWDDFVKPVALSVLPKSMLPLDGLRNADLLVIASCFGYVQEFSQKTLNVVKKFGYQPLVNLLPFITIAVCALIVGWMERNIWLDTPRTNLHLFAILFVEMTTELMLKHVSGDKYQPFRWILIPLVVFTLAVLFRFTQAGPSTHDFLLSYAVAGAVFLILKTTILIHETCAVLNIWCFNIVAPRVACLPVVGARVVPTNGNNRAKSE
jgi:ethanolaminephosphotransferase